MVSKKDIRAQTIEWDGYCYVGSCRTCRVYKPASDHREIVAFKRVFTQPANGEFKPEKFFLSGLHHENIVELKGICTENNVKILILEYVPNGTLYDRLQGTKEKLLG